MDFNILSSLVVLLYLFLIVGVIVAVIYIINLMRKRNHYLKDIAEELKKRNG